MKKTIVAVLALLLMCWTLAGIQRANVLLEIGTGTWCPYCPGAAMGAEDLIANDYDVAVVEYHRLNGDPFENTDSVGRIVYYGISSFPTALFDGQNAIEGGYNNQSMYQYYVGPVQDRLTEASHFTIAATGDNVGNDYTVNVVVNKVETDTNSNLRLHAAITESNIQYNWQGQTHLEWVCRKMLPTYTGTTVSFTSQTQVEVPLSFTLGPTWNAGNCEMVIFLQNNSTKEVLQAVKYSFIGLFGGYAPSLYEINFPDTYLTNTATQILRINNYWENTATGTLTSDNAAFTIAPSGRLNFTIPPLSHQDFVVTFTPTATQDYTGTITMTSNMPENALITIPVTGYGFFDNAPVASNVQVSGIPVCTIMQSASYSYSDADNDIETGSEYQWYRITPPSTTPVPISGANSMSYRAVQADIGSQLVFGVTPRDEHAMPGTQVMSEPTPVIESLPAPQNLTAVVQDEHDVFLDWDPPNHFSRDFLGYRVFRNNLIINTINNPNITSFTDTWLVDGDYEYWVTSVFSNPISQSGPSNVVSVHIGPVGNAENVLPVTDCIAIHPNPFTDNASLVISSKANSPVEAGLYNVKGQLVKSYKATTDGKGAASINLARTGGMIPGLYFVKIATPWGTHTQKLVLLK